MCYERLGGEMCELAFDFGVLLPPFGGVALEALDREGAGVTAQLFAPERFDEGRDRLHDASDGAGMRCGSAAAMTMMPVVLDYSVHPTARDLVDTRGEIKLGRHWAKLMMHYLFSLRPRAASAGSRSRSG